MDAADILSYNAELAKYVLENPTESLPLVSLLFHPSQIQPHTAPFVALNNLVSHLKHCHWPLEYSHDYLHVANIVSVLIPKHIVYETVSACGGASGCY